MDPSTCRSTASHGAKLDVEASSKVADVIPCFTAVSASEKPEGRRGRAASANVFLCSTGAATAKAKVIQEENGTLTGTVLRVPTIGVSVADLTCDLEKPTTPEEICEEIKTRSKSDMKGFAGYCDELPVSTDFETCPISSIRDAKKSVGTQQTEDNTVLEEVPAEEKRQAAVGEKAAAGTNAEPDFAAEPMEQQQQLSDPREVLKTIPWPSSVKEWLLLQSKIWSGHPQLQWGVDSVLG